MYGDDYDRLMRKAVMDKFTYEVSPEGAWVVHAETGERVMGPYTYVIAARDLANTLSFALETVSPIAKGDGSVASQAWYRAEEAAFTEYWKTVRLPQDEHVAKEMASAAWVAWLVSAKREYRPVAVFDVDAKAAYEAKRS